MATVSEESLVDALVRLRAVLSGVTLPLVSPDAVAAREVVAGTAAQLDDYVLPRLRSLDAPLLAVVAGSTGAGKSTLVNALVGASVSPAGVLRPTTRTPVLVHHPGDRRWFDDARVLPRLARITEAVPAGTPAPAGSASPPATGSGPEALRLVGSDRLRPGLALLDAPDIDSVAAGNRALAATLMAAADLWVFVTTAARYSDAVPWQALRAARDRDAAVAVVLDRVPADAREVVTADLRDMLAREGLRSAPLFVVAEAPLAGGALDPALAEPIREWLGGLAADADTRAAVARRTLDGAVGALLGELAAVAQAADRQVLLADELTARASAPFRLAAARVSDIGADGSLLRGEVLARWQEFVGAGEVFRRLETGVARLRDRIAAAVRGEPSAPEELAEALETGLARVLLDELQGACEAADAAWREDAVGRALLAGDDLSRPGPQSRAMADALVQGWQSDVLGLIRAEGAGKRATARALAYGVNGAAVALMVLVFSTTGGLTGAEVGIAGGAALLAQKLLEALFSEDVVRRMAHTARERLDERVAAYFGQAAGAFTARLAGLGIDAASGDRLRVALSEVAAQLEGRQAVPLPPVPVAAAPTARERLRAWARGLR